MAFGGAFCPLPIRLGGSAIDGLPAAQHARLCADLVAVSRTAPLAVWTYEQIFDDPYTVTITSYWGQNGSGLAYAPAPTVNGGSFGDVSFTWSSQVFEDEYGVQHPIPIRAALAKGHTRSVSQKDTVGNVELIAKGVRVYSIDSGAGSAIYGTMSVRVW